MAKLIVYSGDQVVREVALEREPFVIGRALDSDLTVMDHLVSRRHAKLERDLPHGGAWKLVDMGSSNGVFVNEERVLDRVLADGDRLRVGSAVLEFRDDTPASRRRKSAVSIAFHAEEAPGSLSVMRSVAELRADYTSTGAPASGVISMLRERERAGTSRPEAVAKEGLHFAILFQLAGATNDPTISLEDLFDRALDLLVEALDAGVGAILLLDKASGELVPKASRDHRGRGVAEELRLSRTIVNKVIAERVAFLTRDALVDSRFSAGKSVAAMQIRSAICVPIWDAGEVEGVLYVDNSARAGAFDNDDQNLVTAVGHQLAVAIHREKMLEELKVEAVKRENLERYHSPDVVDMILRQQGGLSLEVKEADVTVLFSDIEGFTKMSEKLPPTQVARILNAYFEGATEAIFRNHGQVNKYMGDAILAVFGAPIPNPDHAANGCRAALDMIAALREFRSMLPETERFRMRIGLNSGTVVAGNIGAKKRLEYTVIGNTANVASRLEKIAPPDGVVIGPATHERIRDQGFQTAPLGPMKLKGIESDLEVFQLVAYEPGRTAGKIERGPHP